MARRVPMRSTLPRRGAPAWRPDAATADLLACCEAAAVSERLQLSWSAALLVIRSPRGDAPRQACTLQGALVHAFPSRTDTIGSYRVVVVLAGAREGSNH